MPAPPKRAANTNKSPYAWTTGNKRSITHVAPIGNGGFGEVHKMKVERSGQIVRKFGSVTEEDIENEAKAVSVLCTATQCKFVVEVLKHGWLTKDHTYYFIDMEYCIQTLEDFIRDIAKESQVAVNQQNDLAVLDGVETAGPVALRQDDMSVTQPTPMMGDNNTPNQPADQMELDSEQPFSAMVPAQTWLDNSNTPDASSLPTFPEDELIDWEALVAVLKDITSGLIYIHSRKFVHRDLKPRNVLYSERDACWKLTDFGSASLATSKGLVTTSLARGTASYRAPEVLKYKSNSRTDIFALGCIIFEIITTQRLFAGDWAVQEYVLKGTPIFPDRWPVASPGSRLRDLGQLTSTLLSIEPRDRPGASELLQELCRLRTPSAAVEANDDATRDDDFFDLENSDTLEPVTIGNPTLQSGLRYLGQKRMRPGSCSLFNEAIDSVPKEYKRQGEDWFAVFNKHVPRQFDVALLHTFEHNSVVCCVRFSSDGKYLATGCNRTAQIFEVKTGRRGAILNDESADQEGDLHIRSVCFSPDGRYLATGTEDEVIRIWDIATKTIRTSFTGHEQDIYSVEFSRDGTRLASGSFDRTARLWDMESNECLQVFLSEGCVTTVAISPDGKFLAAGSLDRIVRVWDIDKGTMVERLEGHEDSVYSVAFTPSGHELLSGSLDKTIKLWELNRTMNVLGLPRAGVCKATFVGHQNFVLSVVVSPDGKWVVSGSTDHGVQFWNIVDGEPQFMLQGHKNPVISVALAPVLGGKIFATGSGDCRVRIWSYDLKR